MNKLLQYSALAVFIGAGIGAVQADEATTTGGIKLKSSDGNFEASVGGRVHFDGALLDGDDGADALGISDNGGKNTSGFYFRRVFLSLAGKAYNWEYHIDEDIVGGTPAVSDSITATGCTIAKPGTSTSTGKCTVTQSVTNNGGTAAGFNDVWIAHPILGKDVDLLYIGQHKPWRSMDEIASNNVTPLMERNILSKNGIFGGRDYTQGLYYKFYERGLWAGASFYTDGKAGSTTGSSFGANGRLAFAPIIQKTVWAHAGLTYSFDNVNADGDGYGKIAPGYTTWYGQKGVGVTLVSFSPASIAATSTTPAVFSDVNASTITGELAGAFGPGFFQGEYGASHTWEGATTTTSALGKTATVTAYSLTGAFALTGETRPYTASDATYGGIKPIHTYGAVEAVLRYDHGTNRDEDTCAIASGPTVTSCKVVSYTAGVNYYANQNVRFMLNYQHGEASAGLDGKDNPNAVEARAQFVF